MSEKNKNPDIFHRWSARKMSPVILFYVALVFIVFIAFSHFIFHSKAAVKALVLTAVGSLLPLYVTSIGRVEYRLTGKGLEKRQVKKENTAEFIEVFNFEQLDHIVRTRRGFKYYFRLEEGGSLKRFLMKYFSDKYSGEVHIKKDDQEKVFEFFDQKKMTSR